VRLLLRLLLLRLLCGAAGKASCRLLTPVRGWSQGGEKVKLSQRGALGCQVQSELGAMHPALPTLLSAPVLPAVSSTRGEDEAPRDPVTAMTTCPGMGLDRILLRESRRVVPAQNPA
jgi:hypothetical protein